jgi:hypothetical protein
MPTNVDYKKEEERLLPKLLKEYYQPTILY